MKDFMDKNCNIKIILIVIISFLVGWYATKFFNTTSGQNKSLYTKIHNTFDKEHDDILNACDNLYNACEKHWKTEDEYYNKGIQNMPNGHQNIQSEWQEHIQEHSNTLNSIKQIKNAIVKHINEKDTKHFHWLS
jgi:hemerythrin